MEFRHRIVGLQDWRLSARKDRNVIRYQREIVLKMFRIREKPEFREGEGINCVLLDAPSYPLLNEFFPFTQPLLEDVNSRRFHRREMFWAGFDSGNQGIDKKIQIPLKDYTVKNGLDDKIFIKGDKKDVSQGFSQIIEIDQRNGKIEKSQKVEFGEKIIKMQIKSEMLKKGDEDEEGNRVDRVDLEQLNRSQQSLKKSASRSYVTCRVYDMNLIRYQLTIGNPFAQFLLQMVINKDSQTAIFDVGSKAFEKVWFYKDLEDVVHGPFNCLEMFSWTARNCFPSDLQIASTPDMAFMPMYNYNFSKRQNLPNDEDIE
jgi:hypothetical protein